MTLQGRIITDHDGYTSRFLTSLSKILLQPVLHLLVGVV